MNTINTKLAGIAIISALIVTWLVGHSIHRDKVLDSAFDYCSTVAEQNALPFDDYVKQCMNTQINK